MEIFALISNHPQKCPGQLRTIFPQSLLWVVLDWQTIVLHKHSLPSASWQYRQMSHLLPLWLWVNARRVPLFFLHVLIQIIVYPYDSPLWTTKYYSSAILMRAEMKNETCLISVMLSCVVFYNWDFHKLQEEGKVRCNTKRTREERDTRSKNERSW